MQSKAFNKHPRLSSYSHQLVKTNALVSKLQKTTRSGKRHTSAPPLRLKQSESTSKQQGKFEKVLNLTVPEKPNGLKCFFPHQQYYELKAFFPVLLPVAPKNQSRNSFVKIFTEWSHSACRNFSHY